MCALVAILLTGMPTVLKNSLADLRFSAFPRQTSGDVVVTAIVQRANLLGPVLVTIIMLLLWSRASTTVRVCVLVAVSIAAELGAIFLQAHMAIMADTSLLHVAVVAYLITIALDEIDLRDLPSIIDERRFQRIAMSLGDGLVCADKNGLITVWNPTASAIFGYSPEEMLGCPIGKICVTTDDTSTFDSFTILDLPQDLLQAPGGKLMEIYGRRKNGEFFPLEACFSRWQVRDGYDYGAIFRDISVRQRE